VNVRVLRAVFARDVGDLLSGSDACAAFNRSTTKSSLNCGLELTLRKIPLASGYGDAMFPISVFQPIRFVACRSAALEVKRGNAAWGRKNRHI
jgi:hypothetical protein